MADLAHQDDAREHFADYQALFVEGIKAAWERWRSLPPDVRYQASTRSRASMMYDFICHEIKQKFANMPGVNILMVHRMLVLDFGGDAVVRFKKLDENYRSSNIRTRHQETYTLQLELPHLPKEAVRLTVGYQLDGPQIDIQDIQMTYPVGDHIEWHHSLLDTPDSGMLPYPDVALPPVQPTTPPRVRAKVKKPSGE